MDTLQGSRAQGFQAEVQTPSPVPMLDSAPRPQLPGRNGEGRRGRTAVVLVALAMLLFASAVDGWDWWSTHDVETLHLLGGVPVLGGAIGSAFGADAVHDQITMAVDASYPPFASVDADGKLVGFEVDLATELGRRLALRPKLVNMDVTDSLFDALGSGKVDAVVAGLSYYPDYPEDVVYSDPYYEAGPVLLVSTKRGDVRGRRDLAGRKVAVEVGSVGEDAARDLQKEMPSIVVVGTNDAEQAIAAAGDGAADAALVDRPSIPAGSPAKAEVRVVDPPVASQPYEVAVERRNRSLVLGINKQLAAMKADGTLAALERRWLPQ